MKILHTIGLFLTMLIILDSPVNSITRTTFTYIDAVLKEDRGFVKVFQKPDGTRIYRYADREKAVFRDGTIIFRYSDGRRKVIGANGTVILIGNDGARRYKYPDGSERVVSMDGRTPFGMTIKSHEEKIRRKNALITVRYCSARSDDVLEDDIRKFWDDLVHVIRDRIFMEKISRPFTKTVEISQCRFNKTGYCRRTGKSGISVVISQGTVPYKEISVPRSMLVKPSVRKELIHRVARWIFTR